jgi:hypothetical protein
MKSSSSRALLTFSICSPARSSSSPALRRTPLVSQLFGPVLIIPASAHPSSCSYGCLLRNPFRISATAPPFGPVDCKGCTSYYLHGWLRNRTDSLTLLPLLTGTIHNKYIFYFHVSWGIMVLDVGAFQSPWQLMLEQEQPPVQYTIVRPSFGVLALAAVLAGDLDRDRVAASGLGSTA